MKNKVTIIKQEQELFEQWDKGYQRFSRDGVVDEVEYLKSYPRIIFVMKETNSKTKESVDLKRFLNNEARSGVESDSRPRKPTWDNIARWVHGIRSLPSEVSWEELEDKKRCVIDQWRDKYLKSICVMNMKKSSGIHTTVAADLASIAARDKENIKKQFEIYDKNPEFRPHFIIGCGSSTADLFDKHVLSIKKGEWERTTRGIHYAYTKNGSVFIYYSHPAARVDDALLYYGLIDAVREIRARHTFDF